MKEKISSLIKFVTVIVGFIMVYWGICGAYGIYFGSDGADITVAIGRLVIAVIGAGVAFGGVLVGNIVNR